MKEKINRLILLVCLTFACVIGFAACNLVTAVDFKLQFIVDGEIYATIDTAGEETIRLPDDPEKDGYLFDGWYWDEDTWEHPFTANSLLNEKLTSDMSVYAKWKDVESEAQQYVVTFDSTGGSSIDSVTVSESGLLAEPSKPTKTGYVFVGWYKDADLNTEWNFAADTVTENLVLYAKWVDESDAAGCDILTADGFETEGNNLSIKVSNRQEYFALSKAIVVSPYAKWTVTLDIAGNSEIPSATVSLAEGDNTYYINVVSGNGLNKKQYTVEIRRREIYTVTYQFNNGFADVTEQVEEDGKALAKSAEKTGYTLDCWKSDGSVWDFENDIVASNITLAANWTANIYNVTFESNGGGTIAASTATYDANFTFVVPARTGYTFNGWETEDGAKLTDGEGRSLAAWNIVAETKLYADWSATEYSVIYKNTDGATNTNPVKYTVEDATITLADAQKTGYIFLGWYSDEGQTKKVERIDTSSVSNVVLWAKWDIIEYTATFKDGITVVGEVITFTVETDAITEPAVPEHTGYIGAWESYTLGTENITINAVYIPIAYTITYENTKGATNSNATTYTIESDTIMLLDIAAEGYTFEGWFDDSDQKVTEIAAGTYGNIILTAKWTTIEYAISFIMENEEGGYDGHYVDAENPGKYTIEDEFTFILPICDIRGYEFKGWYTQKQGGEKVEKLEKGTTGAKIYYAQWQRQEYSISYFNIETAIDSNPDSYNVDTETFTLTSPTKKGYEFAGWYSDAEFTTSVNGTVEKGSIGDLQFYAKWEKEIYSITYVLYDGENNGANPAEYTIEDSIELQEPTKEGYTFGGWFKDSAYMIPKGKIENETGNLTLYAKWYYIGTVMFETNGGTAIAPIKQEYGTVLTAPQDPTKEHYTFAGWYSDETLTHKYIFSTMPDHNFTLYAKWIPVVYKITYILNGGVNDGSNPETYTYESETTTLQPATKLGYEFIGWFKDAEFTSAVQEEIVKGSYGDIELYANFRINEYTISFESNGGNTVTSITQNYGTKVSEPAAPLKTGYQFGGWYKNSALTQKYAFTTMPAEDITLYAKWNRISYTISYNLDGGTNSSENPANYTIESSDIVLASPTKNGYAFKGWYSDSGFTTQIQIIPTGSYGELSVFAKWQAIEYSITYIGAENTENNNPAKYTIEDSITLVAAEKSGYTFDGWFADAGYSNKVTQITAGTTGDKTFYAKFMPAVYEVWLDGDEGASYTVTFNLMGGSGSIVAQTVTETVALVYPAKNPTKSGFAFAGWYDNAECTGEAFDFSGSVMADITLYAKWISVTNMVIEMNTNISVDIDGMTERVYDFVPTVSGNVTITTTGNVDTFGYLYNAQGDFLASDDDSGNGGINFQLIYNVTAGEKYTVKVRGYSEKTSGTTKLSLAGSTVPADGGTALETKRLEITFGSEFSLPVPTERIGYTFEGWYDASGKQYTGKDGIGLFAWNIAEDTVLYSKWSKVEFTVTFVTNNGSAVDTVTLSYGARLDLSQYVTTRSGYTFTGWYLNQTDTEPYNATTMPNANLTLYAKWITYNLNNLKYDKTKTAVSTNDTLNAELFNAVCFDTDGKQVSVSVTYSGSFAAGETITVRLTASSNGKNAIKTITGVKVYGAPTLLYDTEKDYINLSDTLNATLFDASGTDSFNEATTIRVFTEDDYDAGDSITVVIQSVDPAGNISEQKIQNVKVYGLPEITYDQTITGIKESDTISASLFGVTGATDSFNTPLEVSVALHSGTQTAGNSITVRLSATDSKGNVNNIDLNIKVYGTPTINIPTNTDIKLGSEITPELLGLTGQDNHGGDVEFSLTTEDMQSAGKEMTYTAVATDYLGNTATYTFTVKIYGQPIFSYYRKSINHNETLSVTTLRANAKDSFGKVLDVSVELVSGTMTAGTYITVRLSATDASDTVWSVEKPIGVYDPEDICLTYSAGMTDSIKLTSNGEEFDASATDSFGEACSLSVRRADGGKPVPGAVQDIVIVATDKAGNTKTSETIAGIKVYGMPMAELIDPESGYIIQEGADISFLFKVTDSFGQELYADIVADSDLIAGETVNITVKANDSAGNVLNETYEFGVLPSDYTLVSLFVDGKLWKSEFVTGDSISVPDIPQGMLFYGWVDESGIKYTNEDGTLLQNLPVIDYIELYAAYYPEGYTPITTAEELKKIQMNGQYALAIDINLGGIEWTPLGTKSAPFIGVFDGNGFTISNFKITTGREYVGLFGYNKGIIKNLGVENFTINVNYNYTIHAGGLVGYNDKGTITNSYATGDVSATSSDAKAYAGGLVGYNDIGTITNSYATRDVSATSSDDNAYAYAGGLVGYNDIGTITNSYATGNVSATSFNVVANAGGLVGYNIGEIMNCYATGDVSATVSQKYYAYVGGLVGYNNNQGTIQNCYRYSNQIISVKEGTSISNEPTNTAGVQTSIENFYSEYWCQHVLGWTEIVIWDFDGDFPTLNYVVINSDLTIIISTAEELKALQGVVLTQNYILGANINLNGMEWTPIVGVMGEFDGNGFTIFNFKITTINYGFLGLFRYNSGIIKNLGVENFTISSSSHSDLYAGGLVGYNIGEIMNCYATGDVSATSSDAYAGGLVGYNIGEIMNCYATGDVNETPFYAYAGGLVGYNIGEIINCYATGDVKASATAASAKAYVGGLVGYNRGTITNSYATDNVSATSFGDDAYVGGLVGYNRGTIANSYATGNVSATSFDVYVGGLVGYNYYSEIANSYATGNVSATSSNADAYAGGLVGYNYNSGIANSYAMGDVSATSSDDNADAYAGGLVGYNDRGTITNCYATGDVQATYSLSPPVPNVSPDAYAGGLVGYNDRGTITNCYATGDVKASATASSSNAYAGGLVGYNDRGTITNCYATGDVSATVSQKYYAYVGGLVGYNNDQDAIQNCYRYSNQIFSWRAGLTTVERATNALGTAKDLETLKSLSFHASMLGWDSTVWNIVEGEFPTLKNVGVIR